MIKATAVENPAPPAAHTRKQRRQLLAVNTQLVTCPITGAGGVHLGFFSFRYQVMMGGRVERPTAEPRARGPAMAATLGGGGSGEGWGAARCALRVARSQKEAPSNEQAGKGY
jgi:hypothetical protein